MSYTTRILPRDEWAKLQGTEASSLDGILGPDQGHVVVVERDGEVVGCWALIQVLHAECVWIAPEYRGKGTVAGRLLFAMRRLARSLGAERVVTASVAPDVDAMLKKIDAVELPGKQFSLPV